MGQTIDVIKVSKILKTLEMRFWKN